MWCMHGFILAPVHACVQGILKYRIYIPHIHKHTYSAPHTHTHTHTHIHIHTHIQYTLIKRRETMLMKTDL
jgi:hypothetical protein